MSLSAFHFSRSRQRRSDDPQSLVDRGKRLFARGTRAKRPASSVQFIIVLGCVLMMPIPVWSGEPASPTPVAGMVLVPQGLYRPLFRAEKDSRDVPVKAFWLDVFPVTNGDFLKFVRANPKWRRSQVKRLFADSGYLSHWAGDLDLGSDADQSAKQPVANVSWFAAKAYAAWRNKRLPTVTEWEYAASAGFDRPDGTNDVAFVRAIQRWYSAPAPDKLPAVGSGRSNFFGVHDLHGLVWEWTSDFNSAMVTGDSRGDTGLDRQLFCGAGSQGASDRTDFAAFMRFGFRSSLKASYTVSNLGFRCARDANR